MGTSVKFPSLKLPAYPLLLIGVLGVSPAAILIRLAEAPALTIATFRMGIAAIILLAFSILFSRSEFRNVDKKLAKWLIISGLFLGLHFAAFITSLEYTTIANSVFLVTTTPVFVAIGSQWILHEKLTPLTLIALMVTLTGGVILFLTHSSHGGADMKGNFLAIAGAITAAGYFLAGRKVRPQLPLLPYVVPVYSVAGILLLSMALASSSPIIGLSGSSYTWIACLTIVSQIIGHTTLNWALARLTATTVSLSVRIEPVIATLIAIPVFGEIPQWSTIAGATLIILGVYLAAKAEPGVT